MFDLDNLSIRVSDATMQRGQNDFAAGRSGRTRAGGGACLTLWVSVLVLSLPLASTGCLSTYAKHSAALSAATAPVVDGAAAAYSSANAIHAMRTDYDAITEFDQRTPVYNPRTVPPLLTAKAIQSRLAVLAAFKAYSESLVAITNGTDSPELQAAAKSAGDGIADLGNTLAPSVETTGSSSPVTPAIQNGVSTAIDALGQFLTNRKVKKELPHIVVTMDPHVKALCDLLESDIMLLKGIEDRDYNFVINQQTLFIREAAGRLDPGVRRGLITKLPEIARNQQESDRELTQLSGAIVRLELTHHALAADLQGNNPVSWKQKLAQLAAAGEDLGKFYSSLP